jgi:TPR repeat protein
VALADMQAFDIAGSGAAASSPDALFQLGLQYAIGRGVGCCPVSAHKWFNLAALRGNEAAKTYRSEIATEMSKADIAEAQRQAREWLRGH